MSHPRGGPEPVPPPAEEQRRRREEEEEEEEEEDGEWFRPQPRHGEAARARDAASRVIVHMDLDCFYAQVEMIRNPAFREEPLGVQQKSLVVTCNYEARKLGVKKLMAVKEAKEKCPQLVLVNGEDLTPYREMSYKVTELLGEFCPLVERLGLDENFMDVTEMVEKRLTQLEPSGCAGVAVAGHIYNNQAVDWRNTTHVRLVVGSQVAQELREATHARLGLTGCAGVASNKLLAKLVSGTFKPNQQTVLLPESCQELLRSLGHIQKVPGIGHKTALRLDVLGIRDVCALQAFPLAALEKELGVSTAQRIQKLSYGEDDSPVTPSGPPQSFSDEDSFRSCSSEAEVKQKIEELLPSLLARVSKDGRQPHTVRLTIRQQGPAPKKWFHRESRQSPVPPHLLQKFGKESSNVLSPLVEILMKLFRKMIDVTQPFHLTLLGVCFANLRELPSSKKGSIGFYLTPRLPGSGKRLREAADASQGEGSTSPKQDGTEAKKPKKHSEEKKTDTTEVCGHPTHWALADVDQEVLKELPEDIQREILSGTSPSALQAPPLAKDPQDSEEKRRAQGAEIVLPPAVDTQTFYELPADVQEELAAGWKRQELPSRASTSKPPETATASRGRRKTGQSNNLLRYFKPQ